MKKSKRFAALGLAVLMCAAMVMQGCGGKDAASTSSQSAAESSASEEAVSSSSSSAASSAEDAEEDVTEIPEEEQDPQAAENLPVSDEDLPLDKCIQLGNYEGVELTKTIYKPTEDDVRSYANSMQTLEELTDPAAEVKDGDVVNLAFVGTLDGKPFENGTSDSYDLEIGSGQFIEGFEEGVIGMKTGETKDLNLKFPDDYSELKLAGKDTVFHVTVNKISRYPELSQEELDSAKETLDANNAIESDQMLLSEAWFAVRENSTFLSLRKKDVDAKKDLLQAQLDATLKTSGQSFEDYLSDMGMTEDDYNSNLEGYAKELAKGRLLIDALAEAMGVTKDDPLYAESLEEAASMQGITSDELVAEAGEEFAYEYAMEMLLAKKIVEKAKITEEEQEGSSFSNMQ